MGSIELRHHRITFPTSSPTAIPGFGHLSGSAARVVQGHGHLVLPSEGTAVRGAVVICPGLGGPTAMRELAYAERLAAAGHAALVLNPYTTRKAAWLPDPLRPMLVGPAMVIADAFAGLHRLRQHPSIGPDRPISVLGFSYGGMVTLLAAHEQIAQAFAPSGERFAGHIAYYGCSIPRLEDPAATSAPVLMLFGEKDCNVSLPRVRNIAEDLRRGGAEVNLQMLPSGWHAWDGWDERRRWVPFSLRDCAVAVGRDGVMRDEVSGRALPGHRSLVLFLARRARPAGYHMQRDPALAQATDAALFSFLDRIAPAAGPEAAAA